jgi:hypothetical protein
MFTILRGFGRPTSRAASLVLATVCFVAACDNDHPVAPKPVAQTTTPSSQLGPTISLTGSLTWKVTDLGATLLGGTQFTVVGPMKATWIVSDNGATDADKTTGQFKLAGLKPGSYQVCQTGIGGYYALPAVPCQNADVAFGVNTDVGTFVDRALPRIHAGYIDWAGNLLGGGVVSIKDSLGATINIVTDDFGTDQNKTPGKFDIVLPGPGTYSVCEHTAPAGYAFPPSQVVFCIPLNMIYDLVMSVPSFSVVPPASVIWAVIDGFFGPNNSQPDYVGPSTFKVTSADGSFTMDVVDDGQNDLKQQFPGLFYVKLPAPGTYTICQVTPVAGHWLANPACQTVTVVLNVVKNVGYFIDGLKQVPNIP